MRYYAYFSLFCRFGSLLETLVKTGSRDGEIKNLVKKLKLIASYTSSDREQAKSESFKIAKAREQHQF